MEIHSPTEQVNNSILATLWLRECEAARVLGEYRRKPMPPTPAEDRAQAKFSNLYERRAALERELRVTIRGNSEVFRVDFDFDDLADMI